MKLYHISKTILIIATLIIIIGGCTTQPEKEIESSSDNLIEISNEQFKSENMQLGSIDMHPFSQVIKTNGIITAPAKSKASVYSYISGIVKSVEVTLGSYVKKGEVLCTIQSKDFITLQQNYLESLAKLKATESNYNRTKSLYNENISSQKSYLEIESEYRVLSAKIQAIVAELKILNVDINKLEKGKLSTFLLILSPIDGHITLQNCNIGQFVDSQKLLMEVINEKELQIHFFVFQEAVSKIKDGQQLLIYSASNPNTQYKATVISIGKSINPETKSIICIADLNTHDKDVFINGMYFQVDIIVESINAMALPSEAIIKTESNHYILVKDKEDANNQYFNKKEIKTGITDNGFTQIIGGKYLDGNVLIKGTYYYQNE
jgi:cobalt-zinc-cadmium efflux system membrane fusion protein